MKTTKLQQAPEGGALRRRVRQISVRLRHKDWEDLTHFLLTDIQNMDDDCEIKSQMNRICNKIREACAKPSPEVSHDAGNQS